MSELDDWKAEIKPQHQTGLQPWVHTFLAEIAADLEPWYKLPPTLTTDVDKRLNRNGSTPPGEQPLDITDINLRYFEIRKRAPDGQVDEATARSLSTIVTGLLGYEYKLPRKK